MMVVTSPMGDHAPPQLAAITMSPAYSSWSLRLSTSLRNSMIITMVVVILSRTALNTKAVTRSIHISFPLLRVLM